MLKLNKHAWRKTLFGLTAFCSLLFVQDIFAEHVVVSGKAIVELVDSNNVPVGNNGPRESLFAVNAVKNPHGKVNGHFFLKDFSFGEFNNLTLINAPVKSFEIDTGSFGKRATITFDDGNGPWTMQFYENADLGNGYVGPAINRVIFPGDVALDPSLKDFLELVGQLTGFIFEQQNGVILIQE